MANNSCRALDPFVIIIKEHLYLKLKLLLSINVHQTKAILIVLR